MGKGKGHAHAWQPVFFHSISWEYLHHQGTGKRLNASAPQQGNLWRAAAVFRSMVNGYA